ncbi:MAG: class I SAM-dependent methyltransferase [Nanoarchaeota archaeon]|nr:class I SAM-dependent methyltransferase [Nanoarchaeota archaeon]
MARGILKVSKSYWETRLPQRWYSKKEYGTDAYWEEIVRKRYLTYFPYLYTAAEFRKHSGKKVLEIGVGVGTDLLQFAKHGAECYGIDLTKAGIKTTKKRFEDAKLKANLQVANAEKLPFKDDTFDVVYSMGVIHHVPDMKKAVSEIHRVLKPGGKAILWFYGKDWKYYLWFPLWGFIQGHFPKENLNQLAHRYMEVEGNVPIVRMFRKKEILAYFTEFSNARAFNHRGYGTSLGKKFYKINKAFAAVMNVLSRYNGWTIKAVK